MLFFLFFFIAYNMIKMETEAYVAEKVKKMEMARNA